MSNGDLRDFDDVERRKSDKPISKERRADCLTYDEHHDVCREQFSVLKEYLCLKLKPLSLSGDTLKEGQAVLRNWIVLIVVVILGGGIWSGITSLNATALNQEVAHVKGDQDTLKRELGLRIDKVEVGISKQLEVNKNELNLKIDKEIQRVIDEIHKLHKNDY